MQRRELAALTLVSGSAGLSYEVLYARLASQYFGEVFYVQAGVLCTTVLGIAIGAFVSPRLRGRLWQVELGLGAYALVAAAVHALWFQPIVALLPAAAGPATPIGLTLVALSPAAVAMGACVPLFAEAWADDDAYPTTYGLYNVGAAVAVLAVEYVVVRKLGLTATLAVFGLVDLAVAWRLRRTPRRPPAAARPPPTTTQVTLVVAGILSSVYQLHALKQMQIFWGPFRETFTLHVFGAIVSIGVTSLVLARRRVGFASWLTIVAVVLPLTLVMPSVVMPSYPAAVEGLAGLSRNLTAALFFAGLYLPPLLLIGGVLPSLYNTFPSAGPSPLGMNALGNAVGFAAYPLLVHPLIGDRVLLIAVAGAWVMIAAVHSRRVVPLAGIASVILLGTVFDPRLYALCFRDLYSPTALQRALGGDDAQQTLRVGPDMLVYRERAGGLRSATVNGHRTVWVDERGGNLAELLHGVLPLAYVRRREHALSIGLGTGISTGALAEAFGHVTALEISPAIVEALPLFAAHNFGVADRPDVDIRVADGLTHVHQTDERYDLILLTVDGPFYQASSKVYSQEFYRRTRDRLAPGGAMGFWIEQSYSLSVVETIVATLRTVFDHCALAALNAGYFQVVCSAEPLHITALRTADLSPKVRTALNLRIDADEFLRRAPSLYFDRVAALANPPDRAINTLDHPILEFAKTTHAGPTAPLTQAIGIDFGSQPRAGGSKRLSRQERVRRCKDLARLVGEMPGCAAAAR